MLRSVPFRMTTEFLGSHKLLFAAALGARAVWELVPMQVPVLVGAIIDGLDGKASAVYGVQLDQESIRDVVHFAAISLGLVAVVYGVAAYAYTVAGTRLGDLFVLTLRNRVTRKIVQLPLAAQQRLGGGELLDRSLRDTGRLRSFIDQVVIRTTTNVLRIGYPVAMLLLLDPTLAWIALSVIPVQWLITLQLQRRLFAVTQETLVARSELTLSVKETLDSAETIQCVNGAAARAKHAEQRIAKVEKLQRRSNRITALIRAVVWVATGTGVALVWWRGSLMVAEGAMSIGALVVFTGFMEFAYRPFRFFTRAVKSFEQGRASLHRIHEVLEMPTPCRSDNTATSLRLVDGAIELRGVGASYGDEPILDEIDLSIEPRQLTALVGSSGSGKSTLLRLIARLHERDAGEVLIDGQSIDEVSIESLRAAIVCVPQASKVFSGTVLENLTLGVEHATPERVRQACLDGGAWEFIQRLPDGLDTLIGPDGVELSGGQAQRLAISRALVCQPGILLLDEPTSALDSRSQEQVMETLLTLRKKITVVLVGHRFSTFGCADKIVLLEDGDLIAFGSHDELLWSSTEYTDLVSGNGADAGFVRHDLPRLAE